MSDFNELVTGDQYSLIAEATREAQGMPASMHQVSDLLMQLRDSFDPDTNRGEMYKEFFQEWCRLTNEFEKHTEVICESLGEELISLNKLRVHKQKMKAAGMLGFGSTYGQD